MSSSLKKQSKYVNEDDDRSFDDDSFSSSEEIKSENDDANLTMEQ